MTTHEYEFKYGWCNDHGVGAPDYKASLNTRAVVCMTPSYIVSYYPEPFIYCYPEVRTDWFEEAGIVLGYN